ncbi:DEAD/DEAH box helicase [Picosynechococcus sp. PCC 73109]|uniref:DEAD/DEAH box helicase n=1 Tax=Picosynechococcus sp. PCC 73109 TaxID=374982 RepID=UPI0007458920|nr:DEAD/DEAH box helicase [Picosynechococcus sp. PCC 73109]AMA10654.1 hypothetical protein AWQ23_14495 [Picosynechococcus sp. PCC 73109]
MQAQSPEQQAIIDSGILTLGFHCILQMPTGSGKTWLSEQAIADVIREGKRAIYLTPLKALANELCQRWRQSLAPKRIGVFTGDYQQKAYPVSYADADLLIMTPEKLDSCLRSWRSHWHWLPEVDLVVVDEFHLLGEKRRGACLEGTLLRLQRLNPFIRFLGLSATLGNRHELADWLGGVDFYSARRPIPLTWVVKRYKKAQEKPQLMLEMIQQNIATGGQSLVFVQSRRRAENLAHWLTEQGLKALHHHAGLESDLRHHVERQFRQQQIPVLVATATLEMGLNLPARQVILYDLQKFDGHDFVLLPVNNVWQRAGRAGRPGLDQLGEVVLLLPRWQSDVQRYLDGQFEAITSHFGDRQVLAEQILVEVATGFCQNQQHLEQAFRASLGYWQGYHLPLEATLREMLKAEMLREVEVNGEFCLRVTRLGRIAVRHQLSPQTILLFKNLFIQEPQWTFLDFLIGIASSIDCEPLLPIDFEDLLNLESSLNQETSYLLELNYSQLSQLLGIRGKRLLSVLHTALTIRRWTRLGDSEAVAKTSNCYCSEVLRLQESGIRLLQAFSQVYQLFLESQEKEIHSDQHFQLAKLKRLTKMLEEGLNEEIVTLTLIEGIGSKSALKLSSVGIQDIEALSLADAEDIANLKGIAFRRAKDWIEKATQIVNEGISAYLFREEKGIPLIELSAFPQDIEPYRLRRALSLQVKSPKTYEYEVTGGLDPHRIQFIRDHYECDCADCAKGFLCKHILAVRLHRGDIMLQDAAQLLRDKSCEGLDLLALWMDR